MSAASRLRGFSIVELLVALALSAILLTGVIAMFLGSRTSYATAQLLSQMDENGRYGLDQIVRDVREAGFRGCAREQPTVTSSLHAKEELVWDFADVPIRGFQYVDKAQWSPALGVALDGLTPGSDVLLVRGPKRSVESARLLSAMQSDGDPLHVDSASAEQFETGDVLLAHNCQARSYFMVSSVTDGVVEHAAAMPHDGAGGNATASLGYVFAPPTELTAVETTVYYVGASQSGGAFASLWRRTGAAAPEEVAVGVEQMQLQFGADSSGDGAADEFTTADAVRDWRAVRSVSIALLVHSAQIASGDEPGATYQLLDVATSAARDGRLRKSFSIAATPRNASADQPQ